MNRLKSLILSCLLGAVTAAGLSGAAAAQQAANCGPREAVVARLQQSFGETRQSIGLGANNALMEVFASEQTGTWTITVTLASGTTCLIAAGQAFETLTEPLPATGKGT